MRGSLVENHLITSTQDHGTSASHVGLRNVENWQYYTLSKALQMKVSRSRIKK